jgi:7-carboxy-7-deazaguanine synthase (Cx14CxxC type)
MTYAVKEIYYTLQGEGAQTGRAAVFCRFAGCNLWSGREQDRVSAICQFCDTDFADTNGPGGGRFSSAEELATAIEGKWGKTANAGPSTPVAGAASAQDDSSISAQDDSSSRDGCINIRGQAQYVPQGLKPRYLRAFNGTTEVVPLQSRIYATSSRRFVVCTGGEPLLQLDAELIAALHERGFEIAVETNGTLEAPAGIDWICVSPKAGAEFKQRSGDELKLVYPQSGADPAAFVDLPFCHFFLQPMDGPAREENTALALAYCLNHPRWRLSLQTHKLIGIA